MSRTARFCDAARHQEVSMLRFARKFFGVSSAARAARGRPITKLALEQLDDRLLPSATGHVSQVMARTGPAVFYTDSNRNLLESFNGGQGFVIDSSHNVHTV